MRIEVKATDYPERIVDKNFHRKFHEKSSHVFYPYTIVEKRDMYDVR